MSKETNTGEVLSHAEPVMGTVASFSIYCGGVAHQKVAHALAYSCTTLHQADAVFSTWDHTSPMSRYRRQEVSLEDIPEDVSEVLDLCRIARDMSHGWFDPWAMPGGVDPTGLVKGWAIEQALTAFARSGVTGTMLNVGGDLATSGTPGSNQYWRIGIRHPWKKDALACVIETDAAVATSGTYERGNILIDPHTGQPSCRTASATVIGPSLALADALATALAVAGAAGMEWFSSLPGYEAYLILPDGTEADSGGICFVDHQAGE